MQSSNTSGNCAIPGKLKIKLVIGLNINPQVFDTPVVQRSLGNPIKEKEPGEAITRRQTFDWRSDG